ncbi:MAG: putative DNA-binding domain-containing protein [Gammaproteobacteria bacterium]|nr:putative DNA-binding domain-containing protein [Gammaproteobacteria bacterium]
MLKQQAVFIQKQFEFTANIRDPENTQTPAGVEERRMNIYRELFYNNIEGFISSAFPVLKTIYSDQHWHKMVRDFFIKHRCQTPLFLEISQEFLSYLQNERIPQPEDPVYLHELAHYEWVELALMISEQQTDLSNIDPNGDLLLNCPVISPLALVLSYHYPVHKLGSDFVLDCKPSTATHLIVYRNRNDKVEFMEVNPVTARLLQLLNENKTLSGQQALQQIAEELQSEQPDFIITAGHQALQQLQQQGIVLGARYSS